MSERADPVVADVDPADDAVTEVQPVAPGRVIVDGQEFRTIEDPEVFEQMVTNRGTIPTETVLSFYGNTRGNQPVRRRGGHGLAGPQFDETQTVGQGEPISPEFAGELAQPSGDRVAPAPSPTPVPRRTTASRQG
jgi:hypothetical protein